MKNITTLFFDVGGICLTNGWDHVSREKSTKEFSLDYEQMERRHKPVFKDFEKGKLSLDEYLNKVVFFKERTFSKIDFIEFMYQQSQKIETTFEILDELISQKNYHLATINNESLELNKYRVNKYNLDKYFKCFFSSCYLGVRKPEAEIFNKALKIFHKDPEECLFVDDREENYRTAKNIGLNAVLIDDVSNLADLLKKHEIKF